MMILLLLLPFLFGDFVEKWYIPQGTYWGAGRIIIEDADRDGNYEFYMSTYGGSQKIYIHELHLPDSWEVDSFSYFWGPLVWDVGDFDLDGLRDLVIQTAVDTPPNNLISIAESPDSFSYPTQEVWRDTAGPPLVLPISAYDIDQDGKPEIVKDIVSPSYYLGLYEAVDDNQYELIYTDNPDTTQYDAPSSTHAFGDFDGDSNIEFAIGGTGSSSTGAPFWVYECIMDNNYEKVYEDYVPTLNIKDCFAVPDADGDGKLEFVVKGFVVPTARIHAFIFEATGDNTYEIVKSFDLFGGHNSYYGGYSDVGDVDGDSIPEIALEGRQTVYIIKAAGNDSFYVWETLPGNNSGSSVRVFDVDGNGLSEVIISGNNQTRIYEYEVGIAEATRTVTRLLQLKISPNPFRSETRIRCMTEANQKPRLQIYDRVGRLVKSFNLESSILNQEYWVVWDGTDTQGHRLPAGVYFIHQSSNNGKQVTPVVLLR